MSLRKSALRISLATGMIGILPVTTDAQDAPAVEVPTAANRFVGEVTADSVNVRSGPADSHYVTTQLSKGDQVIVVGHRFDWLKIVPPKGSFSYVAKIYVDRDGAGAIGTVNRDDVLVRAGSDRSQLKTQPQTKLSAGANVRIIGEQDEYYKILPPDGAYLYIAKQFVRPLREAAPLDAAALLQPSGTPTTTPTLPPDADAVTTETPWPNLPADDAADATEQTAAPSEMTETAPPQPTAQELAAQTEAKFAELEKQFQATKDQPLEQRPVAELRQGYEEVLGTSHLSGTSRQTAQLRVAYLEMLQEQVDALKKAQQQRADFAARQTELEEQAKQFEQNIKEAGIAHYTAVGQLQMSSVQKEGQTLMRLVDPADGRTLVYVRFVDPKQRLLLEKFVGIRGEIARDAQFGLDVIEPSEVEQVDASRVLRGVTAQIYPPSITRSPQE